jgi:hypothetical protein
MSNPSLEQILELGRVLRDARLQYWLNHTFLTWEWWVLVALTLIPWLIWWRFVDKKRVQEILLYGFSIALCTLVIDIIGSNLQWWYYPHEIFKVMPPLVPVDLTVVPVSMMVVYQYSRTWRSFLINNTIFAFIATYIGESFFIWLGAYVRITWSYFGSLLFYIIAGVISRWIVVGTMRKATNKAGQS